MRDEKRGNEVKELSIRKMRNILFKTYQWPPSCLPKDRKTLKQVLERMRKEHPVIKERY